jgi:hypothetical protein
VSRVKTLFISGTFHRLCSMNKRLIVLLALVACLPLLSCSVVHGERTVFVEPEPHLFKSTNYPPVTAEEKAMWTWWDKMQKADPDFEWKRRIEFYGKVLDQFGQPVAGADVKLSWTTVIGPIPDPVKTISTDTNGNFAVTGIRGKGIGIFVSKVGYDSTPDWAQSFEYADFFHDNFHVPDSNNPVLFHLYKIQEADPMYLFRAHDELDPSGKSLTLDMAQGKTGVNGDFALSIQVGNNHGEKGPDYTVSVAALGDAGLVATAERDVHQAPADGYQKTIAIQQKSSDTNYSTHLSFHFYARTRDGKYGVVYFDISVPRKGGEIDCDTVVRCNPSGSRNVEFDYRKWINR